MVGALVSLFWFGVKQQEASVGLESLGHTLCGLSEGFNF